MTSLQHEDFKVLKLKFSSSSQNSHHLFFKPHNVRVEEPLKPRERTLFCANIPPWATVESIKRIFQANGPIENIYFESSPSVGPPPQPSDNIFSNVIDPYKIGCGFKFGYIVFERSMGVKNSMSKMDLKKEFIASTEEKPILVGVKRWAEDYNNQWKDEKEISLNINSYMTEYDKNVTLAKNAADEMGEPDEDGWVTVVRQDKKKANNAPASTKDQEKDRTRGKKNRRKKKKVTLQNFYSHQVKEDKMDKIQELRKKFEEDKLKIAKMKADRKFRPF